MARLPYSRVVNVTLNRVDTYPSRRGFGVPLFLTLAASDKTVGAVNATTPVKVYGSIDEVADDWTAATEFYKAALAAFSQRPSPLQIKVGYISFDPTDDTEQELVDAVNGLVAFDNDWYWLGIEKGLRDKAQLDGLVNWIEARPKLFVPESNDPNTEVLANTTSLAARHKGQVERTAVFYTTEADEYPGFALAAALGTRNFDNSDSAYTAKFKLLRGITPIDKGSAAVQIITGFTPALGQDTAVGHLANTYIDIGGQNFVVEGSVLRPNVFIDEIHATDWIIARTEEAALGIFLTNERVPYTDQGMEVLASAPRSVMRTADRAGLIAQDIDPETGEFEAAVEFNVPSVFDVPASQRKARISPNITVRFRYSGAVHYTTINYTMTF